MNSLETAVNRILLAQKASAKPLAIILAGHNGSGKSTMWYEHLAPRLQIPLINADRMMGSILPDDMPGWAAALRDTDQRWMTVAQKGVQAFVAQALLSNVPFAMETVFSYWTVQADGRISSKIEQIREMQNAGYFVLLFFVGLTNVGMSILRVSSRVQGGGHHVETDTLKARFPRTQKAVREAMTIADAVVLTDNSRQKEKAFTVCRVQQKNEVLYDIRQSEVPVPPAILEWLSILAP